MVYGNFKKKKVKENDDCNPIGIYGGLKLSAERLLKVTDKYLIYLIQLLDHLLYTVRGVLVEELVKYL